MRGRLPGVEMDKPPSQMALALNIARDVFNDVVLAKYQPFLIGAVIVVIALILWLISRSINILIQSVSE